MDALKMFLRVTKIVGKAILGLLLMLILAVAIIHLPPVQEQISRKLTKYLSSKVQTKVSIKSVKVSLLGNVTIEDLTVWDRRDDKILSAHRIEASSDILSLIAGELTFNYVQFSGIEAKLIQSKEGLNIQFIIDAFKPKVRSAPRTSAPVNLMFKEILFENIVFEFTSLVKGITVNAHLGMLTTQKAELSTNPTRINADQIIIKHTVVNSLSSEHLNYNRTSVAAKNKTPFSPDFGTGIVFQIKDLQFIDNDVSFHRDQVRNTRKFDPAHVALNNIQIHLSDIYMSEDSLNAALRSLAVQFPGFKLANSKADLHMTRKQLNLSRFYLASGSSQFHADLTAPYDFKTTKDSVQAHVDVHFRFQITPRDFAYFFSDSVMSHFEQWGPTSLAVDGNYSMGRGKIKKLNLETGNSRVDAKGILHDVLDPNKISWSDMMIHASIGPDFKKTLNPFLPGIQLPSDVILQLKTSGSPTKLFADTEIDTKWGHIKSVGFVTRRRKAMDVDVNLIGEKVDLRELLNQPSLGPTDLSVHAKGTIGENQHIAVSGLIDQSEILNQPIRSIFFRSTIGKTSANVLVSIDDADYRSKIASEILFSGPLIFTNDIQWDDFNLGRLLGKEGVFKVSGKTKSKITIDQHLLEGYVQGEGISFHSTFMKYVLDTMFVHALVSPTRSDFTYFTEHANVNLKSNFDIRDASKVMQAWSQHILEAPDTIIHSRIDKTARLNVELEDASFIKMLGIDVDEFSSLRVSGQFDEQKESASLQGALGKFRGYGVSLDTLNTNLKIFQDNIATNLRVSGLAYDSIQLGKLDFDLLTNGDTATTNVRLANDTLTFLEMRADIVSTDSGRIVYPGRLLAFNNSYLIDSENPILLKSKNIAFNHYKISGNEMQINLNGDLNDFDVSIEHMDLTPLNVLLSSDTTIVNRGYLTGDLRYSRNQQLDLKANIDSLSLYNSNPLTITAAAVSHGNVVPFEFLLTNEANRIDLKGRYLSDSTEVDAALLVDVNNPEIFHFLVSELFSEMNGSVKGKATITGPLQNPALKGSLRFVDMGLTTAKPRIAITVKDDSVMLEDRAVHFDNFTVYDKEHHPLKITGIVGLRDQRSVEYDLRINSEKFNLINNPDSTSDRIRGLLVIDSDIKLEGSSKDTNIQAKLAIKDATNLTFVNSSEDIELITAEGIIDFIDPAQLVDSTAAGASNYYDSLIASLPEFNLHSTVTIEDKAAFRIIINEHSGDYIEASGRADLEVGYDRTGNLNLSGNYTINKGVYRLSFYDLVKKNFELVPGSSIDWSGSPVNGNLNIKARHTVQSNSIGLIGHEIGENEKSIYKRSLDYEVGINISGTVERPVISFLLDLPQDDKVSYPVLANKLDRMRQPEYQSELNKQVFGLLVLGGFLPEANSSNINSNLVATTALTNSVNALLASQLNRFASQHIKGVNIDVGIQSYSDYSAPGGKTQTAMDFRVTKSLMNDRLSFEIGGDFDINQDQSGAKTGNNYRGDVAIIYDLTGKGEKKLKLFNNETYDIVYQEIRNTGMSLIFIRESDRKGKKKNSMEIASKNK